MLAASIAKLVFQYEHNLTDAEAKPWRAAMLRALSQESVMIHQVPLMVEQFQNVIRKYAFHMFVCWMRPPICVSQLLTATTRVSNTTACLQDSSEWRGGAMALSLIHI